MTRLQFIRCMALILIGIILVPLSVVAAWAKPRLARWFGPFRVVALPTFTKDCEELRHIKCDIRKILTDKSIKDMLDESDRHFFSLVEAECGKG